MFVAGHTGCFVGINRVEGRMVMGMERLRSVALTLITVALLVNGFSTDRSNVGTSNQVPSNLNSEQIGAAPSSAFGSVLVKPQNNLT